MDQESADRIPQSQAWLTNRFPRSTLAARVLEAEHRLYPRCLKLVAEGRVRIEGERAVLEPAAAAELEALQLIAPS